MEDTHRDVMLGTFAKGMLCLNPCSNGRYSQRIYFIANSLKEVVLILVLMEDTHRELWKKLKQFVNLHVLILVLMEDTHRVL